MTKQKKFITCDGNQGLLRPLPHDDLAQRIQAAFAAG